MVMRRDKTCGCENYGLFVRSQPSRRAALTAAGAMLLAATTDRGSQAQTNLSPDAALARLMKGNNRYVSKRLTSFEEDLTVLRQNTVVKQQPFAAVLSCSDSRVPVELIFDQAIGHIFVARDAGNICTPEIMASLEYGAAVLGTPVILVLGHEGCGAVKAAIAGKAVPGQISALFAPLRQAVDQGKADMVATIKANAQIQANLLRTASPVLAGLISDGRLKVTSGYYSLGTGSVTLLG